MEALKKVDLQRVSADYDREADVMYLRFGDDLPGFGDDGDDDIILRFADADGAPSGATIIGYAALGWHDRNDRLAEIVSRHLGIRPAEVSQALSAVHL